MTRLGQSFFARPDVAQVASDLLGKYLFTRLPGSVLTGGMIVETEAYGGVTDRASHAYANRRTARNEVMYGPAGRAYVYFCYGMHWLLNVTTHAEGVPHAVLIRALEPTHGIEVMLKRRGKKKLDRSLTGGPACLAQALGVDGRLNGVSVTGRVLWFEDCGVRVIPRRISKGPRVGIAYAGKDAARPWRFKMIDSKWVSEAK